MNDSCVDVHLHVNSTSEQEAFHSNYTASVSSLRMAIPWKPMLLLLFVANLHFVASVTNPADASALRSLIAQWQNLPPSWIRSGDPCDSRWDGVTCNDSRVTALNLNSMNLKGTISGDIGNLGELQTLDLSLNPDLTGPIPPTIGNLKKLTELRLAGCSFVGNIPDEIGNLSQLYFLALNSNKFNGKIPPSLGKLSKLYWLDLGDNQLTGSLPVSTSTTPGLDQLLNANHFHLSRNKLSGQIPSNLFSSNMQLIHILLDSNQLIGAIPNNLGLVKSLQVLRLDRNKLTEPVPGNISNLTSITELHLANNQLSGPMPDLTAMRYLHYVDLSNNSFDESEAPTWFSTGDSLTTLIVNKGSLQGTVPQKLFGLPALQFIQMKNNSFDGMLNMGNNVGPQLKYVDLENNDISSYSDVSVYSNTLDLRGNPVCNQGPNLKYCQLQQQQGAAYSTDLTHCGSKSCSSVENLNPQSCDCANPYQGTLNFRGPNFRDLTNSRLFRELENGLMKLDPKPDSVSLQNIHFDEFDMLQVRVSLFPANETYFTHSEVQSLGSALVSQKFKPPDMFGPYFFIAYQYFLIGKEGISLSKGVIAAIAVSCAAVVLLLAGVGLYAFRQKKRAEKAIELSKPFASWAPSGKDTGGAPQLKGARWFTFDELKKSTSNFSESNEIGSGGYGKVYRGMLPGGQLVAIKRAQQGSMQGGVEFKTEIELLSRVHHKNLVSLVGFCFEQGEQMLVYEYVPNGSLRESLSGRSGIYLDWKRRLRIALGSARGLSYLHELANPPIIHRDVKSSNILLDESLTAKVADFGLSKLVSDTEKGHVSTQVKGTLGYLDPEYYMTQQLTDKSDVYSFGVVMLELITARQPIEKGKYVVREVRTAMDRNAEYYGLKDMMDPTIRNTSSLIGFGRFVELAMLCVVESAAERPTMNEMVKELETILQNDGMDTASTSASSSATDFGTTKGAPRHPYNDPLPKKEFNSNSFDYSGGYSYPAKIEPK